MSARHLKAMTKGAIAGIAAPFEGGARTVYLSALRGAAERHVCPPSASSAMVFAPHPDDETLACGGTIIRKRSLGAMITIVFMTDGAASRRDSAQREELKALRRLEAVEAAAVLGVSRKHLTFLDFRDGDLAGCSSDAVSQVSALLDTLRPREVFIPYRFDEHPDHVATNEIVRRALAMRGSLNPTIFEYPVWFLRHWPLVDASAAVPWKALRALRLLHEFRTCTQIAEVLELKREALSRHRSQMRRGDPQWPSIADDADGRFLDLFLGEYELFRCSIYGGQEVGRRGGSPPTRRLDPGGL